MSSHIAAALSEEPVFSAEAIRSPAVGPISFVYRFARYHDRSEREQRILDWFKRTGDIVGSLVLLFLAAPLFVVIAIAVRMTSPGPVLFAHRRVGKGGRLFRCYKFRTMVPDAEAWLARNPKLRREFEINYKLQKDPRVTPIGAFLRNKSLDELPQLLNVLLGDMSLIGPRPVVEPELERYGDEREKLLTVTPGLSGLWQVCGRNDTTYEERVRMDMAYIDHRCPALDFRILWLTVGEVVDSHAAS